MSELVAFLVGAGLSGLILHVVTYSQVEGGWKTDCEKAGVHVSWSESNKVYQCQLKK